MRVNVTMRCTPRAARRHRSRAVLAVIAGLVTLSAPAAGQAGLTHVQDASPVPRGMVRFSAVPSWMRYDARFTGTGGTEPLGAVLSSEALGTMQLPALTTFESALQSLTGNPDFRLSLGRAVTTTSVRVVTTPLSLEYGLTSRLSLGVTVPIVQRQRELILDIETRGPRAVGNVGPVGSSEVAAMQARARQLASEIEAAAAQLSQRITECGAAPQASGCGAITADAPGAAATVMTALQVAASVRYIYGTAADAPAATGLVPHRSLSSAIDARLQALDARFATYLGGGQLGITTAPGVSQGVATGENVRDLGRRGLAGIGPDSLGRVVKIGIGDVELGARFLLWDSHSIPTVDAGTSAATRVQVMLGAVARLGTGAPADDDELFVPGAGDGQTDAEASIAVDVAGPRRVGATFLARYTAQLGQVAATRLPDDRGSLTPFGASATGVRTLGNTIALEVSPHYRLGSSLYIAGHYALLSRGDDAYTFPQLEGVLDPGLLATIPPPPARSRAGGFTEQRAGIGVTYSTVAQWRRGAVHVPVEVSYVHLETFSGSSAMVPRAGRDQIQLRLYYRLRR